MDPRWEGKNLCFLHSEPRAQVQDSVDVVPNQQNLRQNATHPVRYANEEFTLEDSLLSDLYSPHYNHDNSRHKKIDTNHDIVGDKVQVHREVS